MEDMIREEVRRLKKAARNRELIEGFEPVVAVGFGVVPLAIEGRDLHVAAMRPHDKTLITTLGYLMGRPIVAHAFNEAVVSSYLTRLYLKERSLNFNTFTRPDFLEDPTNFTRLVKEKSDVAISPELALPRRQVVFLDVSMKSHLENLDRPAERELSVSSSDLELPFRLQGERATIFRDEPLPDDCSLLLKRSFRYTGLEYRHGVEGTAVTGLPHNLHPTELQVARLGGSGEVTFFVYDRTVTVWPGEDATLECDYYFLNYGARLHRRLTLKVNALRVIPRERIFCQETPPAWTSDDLCRWLGLDWDDELSHAPEQYRG